MKITVRLAALVACCLQLSLFAASRWPEMPSQEAREARLEVDQSPEVGVIIELTAPPLLDARRRGTIATTAAETVDAQLAQLARDVSRIEGRGRIAADAADDAFRFRYRMVFAGASARVQRTSLAALRALPYVRAVHVDRTMEMYVSESVPHIGAPQVWETLGLRGKGVTIAIVDTGIDYRHWALGKGFGPGFKVIGGYDFYNDDADPLDDHGHGTHVAGIAAGNVAPVVGVAPDASLLAYKVLGSDGSAEASTVLAGIERAIDPNADGDPSDRADVVNMSLGGPISWDDPLVAAVERGTAAGAVFAIAAGNSSIAGTIVSPGAAPSAITVGSVDVHDQYSWFSSRGPVGGTWSLKPEVAAPGLAVTSAFLNGETRTASGTSMASPHVAGLAALLVEQHPNWTPQQVKAAIVSTGKPVDVSNNTGSFGVLQAGGGRIDAVAATRATILPSEPAVSFGLGPAKGQPFARSVMVKLTNTGAAEETLTIAPPPFPAGATVTVSPEKVTLAPGASAEVTFAVELTAAAPKPNDDKIALTGTVAVTGAHTSLHLPLMVVNGDVVTATVAGVDEFGHFISRGGSPAPTWWEGPRTVGAFADATLAVDIAVLEKAKGDLPARLTVRERLRVNGNTPVTIDPAAEAKYTLSVAGVDEAGVPLSQIRPDGGGSVWHMIFLPSLSYVRLTYPFGQRSLLVSPLTETVIHTYENVLNGNDHHFATYRELVGLKGDEALAITAGDWAMQKMRPACKTECEVFVGVGGGSPQLWNYYKLPPGDGTWTLHITPRTNREIDFRAHFFAREQGYVIERTYNPWSYISPAIRNHNGRIVVSPLNRLTMIDYTPPGRDSAVPVGDGPITLQMLMGLRSVYLTPVGPLGEIFGDNALKIQTTLRTADDRKASIVPDFTWAGRYDVYSNQRGAYRLTATDTYTVAGRAGQLTQVSLYDSRVAEAAPSLSALRIENGYGDVTTTVPVMSAPRLVFSARTSTLPVYGFDTPTHTPVLPQETRVWWRRSGTSEWTALPVTMTAADFEWNGDPGSPGNVFTAPLAASARMEGAVDLKVLVKNELGATTEVVYEPAYVVGPAGPGKRRAVR